MIKKIREGIQYKKLTEEERKARGILGRLVGPCADFNKATRNGRKYTEKLWENVFANPIMQEKIKNRVCYGELGHPENRSEIDPEKIAVCLAEQPVKNKNGQLEAVFDILDTPNGRILKALCDYGSIVGVSSRGQGDIITDYEGNEEVDPETYECECWDVVLIPAVKEARMKYVNESVDTKIIKLKKALSEALSNATEAERAVMNETLDNLHIDLKESVKVKEVKLTDCSKIYSHEQACEICKKLDAKWSFGNFSHGEDIEGFGNTKNYYDYYVSKGDLYVYEDGKDSFAFLLNFDGTIYGPYDINDKAVNVNILKDLEKETKEEMSDMKIINEPNIEIPEMETSEVAEPNDIETSIEDEIVIEPESSEEEREDEDTPDITLTEETDEESDVVEVSEDDEVVIDEEPEESIEDEDSENTEEEIDVEEIEVEEDTRTDEEIFVDYLVDNFEEEKIIKACKILGIEVPEMIESDKDSEETDEIENEESVDEMNSTDEQSDEDINAEEETFEEASEEVSEAFDEGTNTLIRSLQEALKGKSDLEAAVKSLQEKLAVSDAKAMELTEESNKYKQAVTRLSVIAKSKKDLEESISRLEESLKAKDEIINEKTLEISKLVKESKDNLSQTNTLNESVSIKTKELSSLKESYQNKLNTLTTELAKTNSQIGKLNENLNSSNKLKESYKKLANEAMNMLIEEKAIQLGLTAQDIKRKLGASYTINDVKTVCEELKRYQLNVSKLPFNINNKVKIKVNESLNTNKLRTKYNDFEDDDIDDNLIRLANI
jgi:hypothetical protein